MVFYCKHESPRSEMFKVKYGAINSSYSNTIPWSIYMPWPFFYCDTHLFFLLAYTCLAYILNSYLSPSKYIEIFFQPVLVFYSCFWCLTTSLSWSFIAFEFCVMLREPQGWENIFLYILLVFIFFFIFGYLICVEFIFVHGGSD